MLSQPGLLCLHRIAFGQGGGVTLALAANGSQLGGEFDEALDGGGEVLRNGRFLLLPSPHLLPLPRQLLLLLCPQPPLAFKLL